VLAVKPQVLPTVCRELASTVKESKPLIISIAAGVRSDDIDAWLGGGQSIVRVMPNQPALLRLGVSGLFANEQVSERERARATEIVAAIGHVVQVDNESDIDTVTAVSGSGPAYFFLLIELLRKAAVEFGLNQHAAKTLAIETATGAAALAAHSDESMDELIARVRSPGGTTAAALDSLEADQVRDIFARAIAAARNRAATLANDAHQRQD
jgi:pyrroline-5-carboxylate reductase